MGATLVALVFTDAYFKLFYDVFAGITRMLLPLFETVLTVAGVTTILVGFEVCPLYFSVVVFPALLFLGYDLPPLVVAGFTIKM